MMVKSWSEHSLTVSTVSFITGCEDPGHLAQGFNVTSCNCYFCTLTIMTRIAALTILAFIFSPIAVLAASQDQNVLTGQDVHTTAGWK